MSCEESGLTSFYLQRLGYQRGVRRRGLHLIHAGMHCRSSANGRAAQALQIIVIKKKKRQLSPLIYPFKKWSCLLQTQVPQTLQVPLKVAPDKNSYRSCPCPRQYLINEWFMWPLYTLCGGIMGSNPPWNFESALKNVLPITKKPQK